MALSKVGIIGNLQVSTKYFDLINSFKNMYWKMIGSGLAVKNGLKITVDATSNCNVAIRWRNNIKTQKKEYQH